MSPRRVCVVTGTRADYGLQRWLLEEIRNDPALELQIAATGAHLAPELGLTWRALEEDGFNLDARIEMLLSSDTPVGVAKSLGLATLGFADAFDRLRPDLLVVFGDRYEMLAAAQAAMVARIPIAHIQGGESTEGLIDEAIRHALTKMSHLHFVAAEPFRRRVIQLGEAPQRVFNVGAPGLDSIRRVQPLDREVLAADLGIPLGRPTFLVTLHPTTLEAGEEAGELLAALDEFPDAGLILTGNNADAGARAIARRIEEYAQRHPDRACYRASLGQLRYLSALRHVDVVIGNSSSGIIEAPALRKPTVNLGDRQLGRLRAPSVLDCPARAPEIAAAVRRALSSKMTEILETVTSPYGDGESSPRIRDILRDHPLEGILLKRFHDLEPASCA